MVDNTVATPILLRPFDHGADIVVHSLTKFLGGHGTTLGGMIVDSGNFPWARHADRFPMFCTPDPSYHGLVYTEHFGRAAYIARCRSVYLRTTGASLSPLSAFLLLQGVETGALRVERHVANAAKVAAFLRDDPRVEWVNYAGFPDNPYHGLVQKYLGGRACSLITFGIAGGAAAGEAFYDALKLVKRLVNLGDAKSLACHPASTTHRQMTPAEQRAARGPPPPPPGGGGGWRGVGGGPAPLRRSRPVRAKVEMAGGHGSPGGCGGLRPARAAPRGAGVTPETIRLSIGIEHVDDILDDIAQALEAAGRRRAPLLRAV